MSSSAPRRRALPSPRWCWCGGLLLALALLAPSLSGLWPAARAPERCELDARDPSLLLLRTGLGVSYKGGHWFHVAESFTTEHVRSHLTKTGSSNVFLALDRPGFAAEMNGVTRLLVLLGLHDARSAFAPLSAQFMHVQGVDLSHVPVGTGIRIPDSAVTDVHKVAPTTPNPLLTLLTLS